MRRFLNTRNLQQVPAHSELGKHIKRCFIAPPGMLYVKVDYRVHEVRGWGLISFDKAVAALFQRAKDLRDEYRLHPTKELKGRLKTEADIHIMNAGYFFRKKLEEVDKVLRNRVKGVIFGLIYQMSMKSLANNIGLDEEGTHKLYDNFVKRFPRAMGWIEDTKAFAKKHFYVETPIGTRRHLWDFLMPEAVGDTARRQHGRATRQSVNSPVQGMCAQFMSIGGRHIDRRVYKIFKDEGREFSLAPANSVHDSLENLVAYKDFLRSLDVIEKSLTSDVRKTVNERYGFDFVVDLEIDFEIGPDLAHTEGWDFSVEELDQYVFESILYQRNELKHDINVEACYREVFDQLHEAPQWLQQQVKNLDYKFEKTEARYLAEKAKAVAQMQEQEAALQKERRLAAKREDEEKLNSIEESFKKLTSALSGERNVLNSLLLKAPARLTDKIRRKFGIDA